MALLATQQIGITGTDPTYSAAGGSGDTINPDGRTVLHVKNADASSHSVTVAVPGSEYGQDRADVVVAVPAGASRFIGPLVNDLADPSDGKVHVTYTATTSVTVAAIRI